MRTTPYAADYAQYAQHARRTALTAATLLAIIGLAACSSLPHTHRYDGNVVATQSANVATCEYLGEVSSSSGLTGLFAPKGVDNIKQNLLHQADAMGATHVVWDKADAAYDSTSLSGKAYRCQPAAK